MAALRPPEPVKLVAALLAADGAAFAAALELLGGRFGSVDFRGEEHPFDATDYYEREMGRDLRRLLVSFARLVEPEALVDAKLAACEMEARLAVDGRRRVNIDVGYLDVHKLVLASGKFAASKVHLGRGVYADVTLRYSEGRFQPFDWTFPDFRAGRYERDLVRIRERYKEGLRMLASPPTP